MDRSGATGKITFCRNYPIPNLWFGERRSRLPGQADCCSWPTQCTAWWGSSLIQDKVEGDAHGVFAMLQPAFVDVALHVYDQQVESGFAVFDVTFADQDFGCVVVDLAAPGETGADQAAQA